MRKGHASHTALKLPCGTCSSRPLLLGMGRAVAGERWLTEPKRAEGLPRRRWSKFGRKNGVLLCPSVRGLRVRNAADRSTVAPKSAGRAGAVPKPNEGCVLLVESAWDESDDPPM